MYAIAKEYIVITYRNVSKKYSEFNLKIDSLDLVENNVHALLGENGAGKTTTIRMTLGLLKPTSGEILFDGRDVFRDASVKQKIGYVPDVPNLYESLTGYEQVNFIANLYKCSNDNYIRELMQKFNIFEEKDQVISSYSKGMKQKISIICALVHKPEILILDEPFTALDPGHIKVVKEYLRDFVQQENNMVLFSTHDLDAANNICTSAIIMNNGSVVNQIMNFKETGYTLEELYFSKDKEKTID